FRVGCAEYICDCGELPRSFNCHKANQFTTVPDRKRSLPMSRRVKVSPLQIVAVANASDLVLSGCVFEHHVELGAELVDFPNCESTCVGFRQTIEYYDRNVREL